MWERIKPYLPGFKWGNLEDPSYKMKGFVLQWGKFAVGITMLVTVSADDDPTDGE